MTYWLTSEEEHCDPRFTTSTLGLYTRAGAWCMSQVRYRPEDEVPPEWFVPEWVVKGWGNIRQANALVDQGVWEPVLGGWRYDWIRWHNTADYVRQERKRQATKKARQRAASEPCSPGTYTGDTTPEPEHAPKTPLRARNSGGANGQEF